MVESVKTALVIGAGGSFGAAAAQALKAHGWQVRGLSRRPAEAALKEPRGIIWLKGDALDRVGIVEAAAGCRLIVHGANPPNYRNWRGLALPMLDNAIAAAQVTGARLVFPGNVYNYGPDAWPLAAEEAPQNPLTVKGRVRVEMEERLKAAALSGVRSILVRAGDFFGPTAGGSAWFGRVMVKAGTRPAAFVYPGPRDIGHDWAYLPDLAEAVARLAEIEESLPAYAPFHFQGHWASGGEMAAAVARALGRDSLPVKSFPWPLLRLARPFVPLFRELAEMRYLWRVPLRLDNRKLADLLGGEPHTPLDQAVAGTLRALGCLPA